jgi:TRAP-type C4-dicarboxylate transport system substrate-binding protein
MKTRIYVVWLVVLLVVGTTLAFHGSKNALAQPIELRFGTHDPGPEGLFGQGAVWYAKELEKRTNGRVKIKIFWSQSLFKVMEAPRAIKSGMADMGSVVGSWHPELFPYGFGAAQGALMIAGAELGDWIAPYRKFYNEIPEERESWKKQNQKILAFWESDRISIISNKPIRNFSEAKGVKIRASGEYVPKWFKAAGFSTVSLTSLESYDAISRGMVDAIQAYPDTAFKYRWYEKCKFWTETPIFGTALAFLTSINLDTFNKLPPDIQEIMVKLGDELTDMYPGMTRDFREKFQKTFKDAGGTSFVFSEAELKEWKSRVSKEAMEFYIQKMEGKGIPKVREIVYRFAELMNYKWR